MEGKILIVKHVENEGPGMIEPFFRSAGWDMATVEVHRGETLPDVLDDVAALIVLGGPMNVYETDRFPFLKDDELIVRKALIEEIPVLGICLGAQLLAKTCGARVVRAPGEEIGWHKVKRTWEGKRDMLFRDSPEHLQVFQWHGDTFDLPEGAVLLAEGKACRNQAFRVGQNAYGLQFHIEVTADMIRNWFPEGVGKISADHMLKEAEKVREQYDAQAGQILSNFMRIVESSMRLRKLIKIFIYDGRENRRKRRDLWWSPKERTLLPVKDT